MTILEREINKIKVYCEGDNTYLFLFNSNNSDKLYLYPSKTIEILINTGSLIDKALSIKDPVLMRKEYNYPIIGIVKQSIIIPIQDDSKNYGVLIVTNPKGWDLSTLDKHILLIIVRDEYNRSLIDKFYISNREVKSNDLFLANMSHEIRTPLNGIIGYLQLLTNTLLSAKQKEYILAMNKCGVNLLSIINDILDYSKLLEGKMKITISYISLKEVFDYVISTLNYSVKSRSIIIEYDKSLFVNTDKQKLIQILINLLSNAIKFTSDRGNIKIRVILESNNPYFYIEDDGVGISIDNQRKLFTSFTRLNDNKPGNGLGLVISKKLIELLGGNITVKSTVGKGSTFIFNIENKIIRDKISKDRTGNVLVYISNKDDETKELYKLLDDLQYQYIPIHTDDEFKDKFNDQVEFVITNSFHMLEYCKDNNITIPVLSFDEGAKGMSSYDGDISTPINTIQVKQIINTVLKIPFIKKHKSLKRNTDISILIAEDDGDSAIILKEMLLALNYTKIQVVTDGITTLNTIISTKPDLVLLDIKLPKLDGFEILENVNSVVDNKPKIVPVTASILDSDRDRCFKLGCQHFITKPVIYKELRQMLYVLFPAEIK